VETEKSSSLSPQKPSVLLRLLRNLSSFLEVLWSKFSSTPDNKPNAQRQERQANTADQKAEDNIVSSSLFRETNKDNSKKQENNPNAHKKPFSLRALLFILSQMEMDKGAKLG